MERRTPDEPDAPEICHRGGQEPARSPERRKTCRWASLTCPAASRSWRTPLGIVLFRRTSKGITPTAQGEEFLSYARSVLSQIEEMENHFSQKRGSTSGLFSISVPRASYITQAFTRLVAELDRSMRMELRYNETSSMRAINNILQNGYNLGIILLSEPVRNQLHEPAARKVAQERGHLRAARRSRSCRPIRPWRARAT